MRYKRISLINPPIDDDRIKCIDAGHWQPLNLIALGSFLRASGFNGEIQLLDQEIMSIAILFQSLIDFKPDLIGISPNLDSYQQTLNIARIGKGLGADIVLGGSYASALAYNIIQNRTEIDYIIVRDGEEPLNALIQGMDINKIDNLVFRQESNIAQNPIKFNNRATYSELDYSLIEIQPYFDNYARSLNPGRFKRPIAFLSQRGCVWKDKTGGCVFCSRELGSRFDNVKDVWQRIKHLQDTYQVDAIMDTSDDFLGNQEWFHEFHRQRPEVLRNIGIRFIYSRVEHITDQNADLLKDLGTFEVFLGIESGDQEVLRHSIKGNSIRQQFNAVKRLEERNINVALGFVLGLPGENEKTLNATFQHVESMLMFSNINEIVSSLMTPLPGSPSYSELLKHEKLKMKYVDLDIIPLEEMQYDWVQNFCKTDFDVIQHYAGRINALSSKVTTEFIRLPEVT